MAPVGQPVQTPVVYSERPVVVEVEPLGVVVEPVVTVPVVVLVHLGRCSLPLFSKI
jgi:hypothetical protein